jgi:hypothetical protein
LEKSSCKSDPTSRFQETHYSLLKLSLSKAITSGNRKTQILKKHGINSFSTCKQIKPKSFQAICPGTRITLAESASGTASQEQFFDICYSGCTGNQGLYNLFGKPALRHPGEAD